MKKRDTALPSIQIDPDTKRATKIKSAEEGISISAALRAFLHAWVRGDPAAAKIVADSKKK